MSLDAVPLFAMIKGRLKHLDARQTLIAENVANADTPGFTPRDLKSFSVRTAGALAPVRTNVMHISPSGATSPFKPVSAPDSETTLDGNSVVLEEEMIKLQEARSQYDAAISLYQKSLGLLRMAARAPGR